MTARTRYSLTSDIGMPPSLQSAFGLVAFLVPAWVIRERRAPVPSRTVASGVALQRVVAAAMLRMGAAHRSFAAQDRLQ